MKDRLALVLALVVALGTAGVRADVGDNSGSDPDGSATLAERLTTFAHQTFHQKQIPQKALQLDAALYRAAVRLNPHEPRFARSLADVLLELNDIPGATEALKQYMALVPSDQTAQVQYVDLCLASDQMQSLDQRLNYLRFLLRKQQIPLPVKSEIAYRAAQYYMDRGQKDEAMKLLDSARLLNPTNLKVLRIRYIMTQETALAVDRVQQLLGILQANPADPVVASRLAEQLAQLGLVDQSITWYGLANKLYQLTGVRSDPAFVLGASSELLIAKHAEDAAGLAANYTNSLPSDADGWFVILSVLKFQLSLYQDDQMKDLQTATIRKAGIAIANRLLVVRKMTGDSGATTRPIDSPTETTLPDLSDDADRFKASQYRPLEESYISALQSLAWLDLYYRRDAAAAQPLIDDLARLVPATDGTLLRLRAWGQYIGGDAKGALAKFNTLAGQDPLAALGAIEIELADSATQEQAVARAQKLLNDHPAGVVGAILWAEFYKLHLSIQPSPDSGTAATLVMNVPQAFLQLVTEPRSYYTLQVAPLKSTYTFGEPVLVRVTMQNISNVDLAIADDCAIHPELWFDAHLRGMLNQNLSGVAIGRLDQRLVLAPGESVSTVVRVDQDAMQRLFDSDPRLDLEINLALLINPTVPPATAQNKTPQTVPGICGFAQYSDSMVTRVPTPIDQPEQRLALYQGLNSDDGGVKILAMETIAAYVHLLKDTKAQGADAIIGELMGKLHRVDSGGKQPVVSYQRYLLASLASGSDQVDQINSMADDEHWQTRLLALNLADRLAKEGIPIAQKLTGAKDPIVSDYAGALVQSLQAASTQPSDEEPTTNPSSPDVNPAPDLSAPTESSPTGSSPAGSSNPLPSGNGPGDNMGDAPSDSGASGAGTTPPATPQ